MNGDPIDILERELVEAAHRSLSHAEPSGESVRTRHFGRQSRRLLGTVAVLVPVIVVATIVLLVRPSAGPDTPSLKSAAVDPRSVLAVLRQKGTAPTGQDLSVIEQLARSVRDPRVVVEHDQLRQIAVRVGPHDTAEVDLAIVRTPEGRQLLGLTVGSSGQSGTAMQYLYAKQTSQAYATVAQLRSGGVGTWLGPASSNAEGYAVLVPDGVARVRLDAPGYPTARVHDNVAGFRVTNTSPTALSKQLAMTWLDSSGHVVRRVAGAALPSVARLSARVNAAVRELRTHLAVLRQPITSADRAEQKLVHDLTTPGETVIPSSVRVARVSAATGRVVVAIERETAYGTAAALLIDKNGGSPTAVTQLLRAGGVSSTSGSSGKGVTLALVPDNVDTVALTADGRTTRAQVIHNVAILQGDFPGLQTATTWYGANGTTIKHIPAPTR